MSISSSDLSGKKVAVTGSTGFIGRAAVAALRDAGAELCPLVRQRGDTGQQVDFKDETSLMRALEGADMLVHLAYDVRADAATNLADATRVFKAAAAANVERIVLTSSAVVYDAWPDGNVVSGGAMTAGAGGTYRDAKIAIETAAEAAPVPAFILQPTLVYGPGSALWTDGLARALKNGGLVIPQEAGKAPFVFVGDVARALVCACLAPSERAGRFVISGASEAPWLALLSGYAEAMGVAPPRQVPAADIWGRLGPAPVEGAASTGPSPAARLSRHIRGLVGHRTFERWVNLAKSTLQPKRETWPDRHLARLLCATGQCDISAAQTQLGYEPQTDLEKGLAVCAPHLRNL